MNLRKGKSWMVVFGLGILLCSIGISTAAAETVLKTWHFELSTNHPSKSIDFQVPGPGRVILSATAIGPTMLQILVEKPNWPYIAKYRRAPLRMDFDVSAQDLANGNAWQIIARLLLPENPRNYYQVFPLAGDLTVSFVSDAPAQKTALRPNAIAKQDAAGTLPASAKPSNTTSPAAGTVGQSVSQPQGRQIQIPMPGTVAPRLRNPSAYMANPAWFTAKASAGGDVFLKWAPVPNALSYNLQGPGVQVVSGNMPPNVTGTSYTVKGLPVGTHSWTLFAVYNGTTGPYFGDEKYPARTELSLRYMANPAWFTAKAGNGGAVLLKWAPVPNAITYNLQGPGVQTVPGKMPPNISGTSYKVKGLSAGTYSWTLFAVYDGATGPYFGDETSPARAEFTVP